MPNILKARSVTLDSDNVVNIEITPIIFDPESFDETEEEAESPEETAKKLVQRAGSEAEQIVANANAEANAIVESAKKKAQSEAEAIKKKANEDGYNEGYGRGVVEGKKIVAEAQKTLEDAKAERAAQEASLEPDTVSLISDIVDKLLNTAVNLNRGVIVNLIRQGIAGATLTGNVEIHVSPSEYESALEHKEDILSLTDSSVRLEFVRDPSLNEMDCVIETQFGCIDASLGQQYETLCEQLRYILRTSEETDD